MNHVTYETTERCLLVRGYCGTYCRFVRVFIVHNNRSSSVLCSFEILLQVQAQFTAECEWMLDPLSKNKVQAPSNGAGRATENLSYVLRFGE